MPKMRLVLVVAFAVLGLLPAAALAAPTSQAASCRFVLGFKALHAMIPAIVGDCLDDEQHNLANGDGLSGRLRYASSWRGHP